MKNLSIIIPVLNEAPRLESLLPELRRRAVSGQVLEILVVDGGSSDLSREVGERLGARVLQSARGRAVQLNAGARAARGELLYFLHADSLPPDRFDQHILQAGNPRPVAGCFRLAFEPAHWFLDFFAWWTRFNHPFCRGGDQSLFIPKAWFEALGGFNEAFRIYEDNEFTGRVYRQYPFAVLPEKITTSARRYHEAGIYRLQYHYTVVHLKRRLGSTPEALYAYYEKKILGKPSRQA